MKSGDSHYVLRSSVIYFGKFRLKAETDGAAKKAAEAFEIEKRELDDDLVTILTD